MTRLRPELACILALCPILMQKSIAQGITAVTSIAQLRTLAGTSPYSPVIVQGYSVAGDGGGGTFSSTGSICVANTVTTAGWQALNPVIPVTSVAGLAVGMATSMLASGIPPYDQIIGITTGSSPAITLAAAPTTLTTGAPTLLIGCDNGGTSIVDTSQCPSGHFLSHLSRLRLAGNTA